LFAEEAALLCCPVSESPMPVTSPRWAWFEKGVRHLCAEHPARPAKVPDPFFEPCPALKKWVCHIVTSGKHLGKWENFGLRIFAAGCDWGCSGCATEGSSVLLSAGRGVLLVQ